MKKRLLFLTVGLLAAGGLVAWIVFRYVESGATLPAFSDQETARFRAKMEGAPTVAQPTVKRLDLSQPLRFAIGSVGLVGDENNRRVSDLVLAKLSTAKGLQMVERQSLDLVLKELRMSMAGLVRAKDAVRVGKLVQADWFLLGTGTQINGANSLVLRIVDAHTGILREASVFAADESPPKLASQIAGFVRRSRENAALAKPTVYLAIGSFEDLSLNSREQSLPGQLRSYLISAFQGKGLTLLEREAAGTLLKEIQLDLAGLAEGGSGSPPQPLLSAYWVVGGYYQSVGDARPEVELVLQIRRMFGKRTQLTLRERSGEPLFRRVRDELDSVLDRDREAVVLSWVTEMKEQMRIGIEMADLGFGGVQGPVMYSRESSEVSAKNRRNTEEAIQAFETVLLLSPTNREAKMYLAGCYLNPSIRRYDEARSYYRQVLEEPVSDAWSRSARSALLVSFHFSDAEERMRWFQGAAQTTTNAALAAFYREQSESAELDVTIRRGGGNRALAAAEKRLFEQVKSTAVVMRGGSGTAYGGYGISSFIAAFGNDRTAAEKQLVEILPRLQAAFPDIAPHLAVAALEFQSDTNTPVLAAVETAMETCLAGTQKVTRSETFWGLLRGTGIRWAMEQKQPAVTVRWMDAYERAVQLKQATPLGEGGRVGLAYVYMAAGKWEQALAIFEALTNRPVLMSSGGPWGRAWMPVLPREGVAFCREKLGLPKLEDRRELRVATNQICVHSGSAMAAATDGLWLGTGNLLLKLDLNAHTNSTAVLPKGPESSVSAILAMPSTIWIATSEEGLIEFDKATRKCRQYTVRDGLVMNGVSSLHLQDDTLWIGYGRKDGYKLTREGGGLGRLDLSERRFHSHALSLASGAAPLKSRERNRVSEPLDQPTHQAIRAMISAGRGELWFVTGLDPLRRFRLQENVWSYEPRIERNRSLATASGKLFVSHYSDYSDGLMPGPIGVTMLDLQSRQCSNLRAFDGFPAGVASAVYPSDPGLWIGGLGYLALVDPKRDEMLRYAYVCAREVDQLVATDSVLWAIYDKHLHWARLDGTN